MRSDWLLLVSLLGILVPSVMRADVLSAGSAAVERGDSFNIPVMISGATNVYAFQFDMTFNPGVVQLQSIDEGSFLTSAGSTLFIPGTIDNVAGTATFTADTLLGPDLGVAGSGTLATFNFVAESGGSSSLDLVNVSVLDSNLNDIPFITSSGSVTVTGVPEPGSVGLLALAVGMLVVSKSRFHCHSSG